MQRRSFVGGLTATAVTAVASYFAFIQPADTEIAELETQVTELDTRVDALETQVAGLSSGEGTDDTVTPASGMSVDGVTLEGVGTKVPDPFPLAEGRYRVTATAQSSNGYVFIIVHVIDPSGATETVFNHGGEATDELSWSTIYSAPEDGEYIISVSNTDGPWSLVFEPI